MTCLMPDCPFSGSNVMWHLRGQPHVFSEAQIQHILKGDVVKKPRLMTKVACPLQGQAMTAANDRVCQTSANIRLDLHLPKHGLSRGTQDRSGTVSTSKLLLEQEVMLGRCKGILISWWNSTCFAVKGVMRARYSRPELHGVTGLH